MGGQFWSAFISCKAQFHDAVQLFLEQIDVIRQMVAKYPDDLMWAVSSDDIQAAISSGKIASLIGVESGHAIGSSLAILRTLYQGGFPVNVRAAGQKKRDEGGSWPGDVR